MISEKLVLVNKLGLHARASAKLAQQASQFGSCVHIGLNEDQMVDCKSIMALMMLAAGVGTEIYLRCDGEDEERAMDALRQLIADRFGEDE